MCAVCGDNPGDEGRYTSEAGTPERLKEVVEEQRQAIMDHGHQIIGITDVNPGFFYTVGRAAFDPDRPELLLTGNFSNRAAMNMLNDLANQDTAGKINLVELAATGVPTRVENFNCDLKFLRVDPTKCEMFQAITIAGGEDKMIAIQVVWPDSEGHWPDDPEFLYGPGAQPVGAIS